MKISVYARGSNPAVDRHIQRKSLSYCERQVKEALADWVDPSDPTKGILCREFLAFGEKLTPAAPEQVSKLTRRRNSLPPLEVSQTQYDDPIKNSTTRQDRHCLIVRAEAFARLCELALYQTPAQA